MSVMSFLHALENNLAIWILSITPCLRAVVGAFCTCVCAKREGSGFECVCLCVRVLV